MITAAIKGGLTVKETAMKITNITSETKPKSIIGIVSDVIGIKPKATVLIGKSVEVGASIEVLKSKHTNLLLDGWSVDVFGGTTSFGAGIAKDIFKSKHVELDAGLYAVRPMKGMFDSSIKTGISAGISVSIKF